MKLNEQTTKIIVSVDRYKVMNLGQCRRDSGESVMLMVAMLVAMLTLGVVGSVVHILVTHPCQPTNETQYRQAPSKAIQ